MEKRSVDWFCLFSFSSNILNHLTLNRVFSPPRIECISNVTVIVKAQKDNFNILQLWWKTTSVASTLVQHSPTSKCFRLQDPVNILPEVEEWMNLTNTTNTTLVPLANFNPFYTHVYIILSFVDCCNCLTYVWRGSREFHWERIQRQQREQHVQLRRRWWRIHQYVECFECIAWAQYHCQRLWQHNARRSCWEWCLCLHSFPIEYEMCKK